MFSNMFTSNLLVGAFAPASPLGKRGRSREPQRGFRPPEGPLPHWHWAGGMDPLSATRVGPRKGGHERLSHGWPEGQATAPTGPWARIVTRRAKTLQGLGEAQAE